MADSPITLKIEGLDELRKRLSDPRVKAAAKKRMNEAARVVIDAAKSGPDMPVNNGQLRSSMTWQVHDAGDDVYAEMGSPLQYAPYMEYGTGTQSDGPGGTRRPHYPPPSALAVWAKRHGMEGMEVVIARAIGRRGGLKPRKYLRNAWAGNLDKVRQIMGNVLDDVANRIVKG